MAKIERICEYCGKTFFVWPFVIKNGEGLFCSAKCYHAWLGEAIRSGRLKLPRHKNKVLISCQYCGKEFRDHPSANRKYCSRKCSAKRRMKIRPGKEEIRKLRRQQWEKKLGKRRLEIPICRLVNEDSLVNFVMKNPSTFGYTEVFLHRTSDFDMIGIKTDGTIERVEIEHDLSAFLRHHHPENCDRVIAYYKTKATLPVPFHLVEPKMFIPFAEKIVLLARKKEHSLV